MKKYAVVLITLLVTSVSLATVSTEGLRLWCKMNEIEGSVVHDSSGNNFHGTKASDVLWNNGSLHWTADYSSGVSFNAVAADIFSTVDDQLTLAFWVKSEATSGSNTAWLYKSNALGDSSTTTYGSIYCEYPSYDAGWWHMGRADKMTHYNSYINFIGSWTHWVISKDMNTGVMKLYKNGEFAMSESGKTQSMAGVNSFTLGTGQWKWFKGQMRDFRIYDRILDESEIWSLANPADINNDKLVNINDFQLLVYNWLDDSLGDGDINKDGIVNFKDYTILLNNWREAEEFYFDNITGNDNNSGTSPDQAWNTLSKFNSTTFLPGDKIYFKTDCVWTGQLAPKGSGISGSPIIVDAYGTVSDQSSKPRFDGEGAVGTTLNVHNVEYWEFNNLQITNLGETRAEWRRGAYAWASGFGTMEHIHFKNLYVHSVNSSLSDGEGSAMGWFCSSSGGILTKFNDLLIENCLIENAGRYAIQGGNSNCGRIETATDPANTSDFYPSTNVVIRGNRISNIDGSGINIIGTDGCIVEYNVIDKTNRDSSGGCGIWPWSADNTIIQYNEIYDGYDNGDGESYDSDYNCRGTIFQYNYSHDNPGGFMRLCNEVGSTYGITGNYDTVIRYNISVNDGDSDDSIFPTWKRIDNVQIYNNVIYSPTGTVELVGTSASGGSGGTYYWWNNIFFSNGTLRYNIRDGSTNYWSNNCFYGTHQMPQLGGLYWSSGTPSDANKITSNPNFISPSLSAPIGIDSLDGFKLQPGSPCIGTGKTITGNGGYDFWGNILYNGNPDIGAHEK